MQTLRKKPDGFIITIDNAVVAEAGVNGVIKDQAVAERLRDSFRASNPTSSVVLFGIFTFKGAS